MPPKRRRRFQGLYYHSSPPKVLPMNGQIANNTGRRRRDPDDLSVKLSTIRIWMHEKDIGKLTRVLWAGQGNRLRQQASTNPKVKRFLAAVPYVMNSIKDVHQAVIDNSLENLQANLEPPVPPALVTCRDANGLNLIHKAAGLGHATILEYLIQTWPDGVHETDITGKTPLHWAASAKNNMRCYTLLTQAGCDEEAVDYKMKTPSFYRHKPHEIERAFLTFVPEAPRVSPDIATDWEALSDESGDGKKLDIKIPEMNGFGRHSNAESNENTSEAEMTEAASGQEDEEMSKDGDAAEENAEADAESEPEEEKEPETKDENEGTEEPPAEEKENEKEDATETKEDEEKEKEEAKEKEEEKEEEKETQNETEEKEEEKPQDEKQQTETLNVTTANLTKASEEQQEEEKDQNKSNEGDNNTSHTEDDGDHKAATDNEKMGEESKEGKEIKEQEIETTDEKSLEKEQNDKDKEPLDKGKIETKEDDNENVKETADDEKSIEKDNKESIKEKTNEPDNEEEEKATSDEKTNQTDNSEKYKENLEDKEKESSGEEIKTGDDEKSKENVEENKKEISGEEIKTSDENVNNEEEKNIKNSELKIEQDQSEDNSNKSNDEEKDNDKDNEESKTLGETLVDIKDEVKENVKYLANSIKNVFSDKTPNKEEEDVKENSTPKADENKDNLEKVLDNEKSKEAEDKTSDKETDHKAPDNDKPLENEKLNETDENEDKNKQSPLKDISDKRENIINNENPKEKTEENKETTVEPTTSNDKGPISSEDDSNENAQTKIDDAIKANENSNISNEITKIPTPTSSPPRTAAKTPTKETPKKENDKTEEDENNNTNKLTNEIANSSTTTQKTETTTSKPNTAETLIDDKLKELNKSLEEYQKEEEQALEKEEKDIGEKLEEMADSLKENVKDMADKVVNLFSTTKDATEKMENESSEVVVHTESPHKQTPSKKVVKDTESSDETADEDEEPEGEAENEENNNEQNEEETQNDEENKDENENEAEAEITDPKPEQIDQENKSETEANAETEESKENENDNLDDEEREGEGEGSLTSSLAIEGFVQGDAEDNTVQSQTAAYVHDDEEQRIQNIITSGDMEQLAQIVLNGDGQKLLNVEATEPEIQAFLKNVPNYMGKIKRVHEAARNGSLLNLQQALDRRKFAIAKDEISPNGATPLHVAVLFGNSDIVRYLSARFPETMTITDDDGRTPLHYASVINDNGHFYNVLLQLGANPKDVDKMGHTPEDYLSKEELKDILNYGQLLKRFGAEELEEQLLSDQGQIENQSCQENPIFKTEQGKYLADNLADPLIKALTQVAQKRPNDPLQYLTNYLQSYVSSRNTNGRTIAQVAVHSGSSQTNSTRLASSKPSTPAQKRQTTLMNGHAKYDNTDNIEEDSMQQNHESEDDGNDSDAAMSKKLEERDEHGQSMLHFACARSHRKGGLIHLIEEAKADITYRDELYRTARDVALQANQLGNAKEIDRYVMSLAIVGDIKPFEHFAVSGYDHIIDILDENETPIIDVVESRGLHELAEYLKTIRPLEELREELHQMIRDNNVERVKEIANGPSGKWLIKAKNYYGRTALHIAILKESIEIVEHFIKICPEALKIGDNLERTPLHYAMGTNIIESISRILIQNGAKRTYKDLKGRQPSYYFMNKADILRLQEEEDENR